MLMVERGYKRRLLKKDRLKTKWLLTRSWHNIAKKFEITILSLNHSILIRSITLTGYHPRKSGKKVRRGNS